jgi:hypothetical protein
MSTTVIVVTSVRATPAFATTAIAGNGTSTTPTIVVTSIIAITAAATTTTTSRVASAIAVADDVCSHHTGYRVGYSSGTGACAISSVTCETAPPLAVGKLPTTHTVTGVASTSGTSTTTTTAAAAARHVHIAVAASELVLLYIVAGNARATPRCSAALIATVSTLSLHARLVVLLLRAVVTVAALPTPLDDRRRRRPCVARLGGAVCGGRRPLDGNGRGHDVRRADVPNAT